MFLSIAFWYQSHVLVGDAMFPVLASLHPSTGFSICLSVQIGATALFLASSCYASKQHCNSIGNFCKWSFFLQWTFWNTVSRNLLQSVTSHCVVLHHSPAYRIASHCFAWLYTHISHLSRIIVPFACTSTTCTSIHLLPNGQDLVAFPCYSASNSGAACLFSGPVFLGLPHNFVSWK